MNQTLKTTGLVIAAILSIVASLALLAALAFIALPFVALGLVGFIFYLIISYNKTINFNIKKDENP